MPESGEDKRRPPFTVGEYAALHGVSTTTVKRWVAHGRVPVERRGGGTVRAAVTLILTDKRPDRLAPGALTEGQRAAWNKGKKPLTKPKARRN